MTSYHYTVVTMTGRSKQGKVDSPINRSSRAIARDVCNGLDDGLVDVHLICIGTYLTNGEHEAHLYRWVPASDREHPDHDGLHLVRVRRTDPILDLMKLEEGESD